MIQLEYKGGMYTVRQKASLGNIEKERIIGVVIPDMEGRTFMAYPYEGTSPGRIIADTKTLPAAINALIELHKLTDYQYAPWPSMEEDEE